MSAATAEAILILEDDEGVAYLQRRQLERAGYRVVEAATPDQALSALAAGTIDLIVLDYRLAGESTGLDFYEQLKAAGYDVPVIMVTGFSQESTVIKALRSGVRDFVSKSTEYLEYLPVAVDRVLKQVHTEKALRRSEEQLRQAQKMEAVGRLAGGVAHEFNNLLQIILGFGIDILETLPRDDEAYEDMQEVIKAAKRAAALTRQLLTFGRRQAIQRDTVDLRTVVSELMKMLQPLLGKHIEVEVNSLDQPALVLADAAMIQQAIMNLCVNARDAMSAGGKLRIDVDRLIPDGAFHQAHPELNAEALVRVRVCDTGEGISPEYLPHLFEPFFTTKGVGEGTGLGLATVFAVVQEHGGAIEVNSQLRVGTTFTLFLPAAQEAVAASAPAPPSPSRGGCEGILVAEDEPALREYMFRILRRAGYQVFTASDGEEAVRLFQEHAADISLVILDMIMPRQVGRRAYELISEIRPGVPAIFVSGYDPNASELAFVRDQGVEVLQKPVDRAELFAVVRRLLDARSRRHVAREEPAAAARVHSTD